MENNEDNLKPQPTGGLKLMTVFVGVLALHVIVLGSFGIYSFMKAASNDGDLSLDKKSKTTKIIGDTTLAGDVTAPVAPTMADATISASTPATTAPAPTTPPPATTPVVAETEAPAPVATPAPVASAPVQRGPVISPPENLAPVAPPADVASNNAATTIAPAESSPMTEGTPYTVKKGDSLARIAHRQHVPLAKLRTANSLPNDKLSIGQKLVIPGKTTALAATSATPTTISSALTPAPETDPATAPAPVAAAVAAPAAHPAHATHAVAKTASGHHLYTVVKGDTLIKIARKFKTTPTAIMTANNLTNAARLSIGKKLRIPSGEARSASTAAPAPAPVEEPEKAAPKGQLANYVPR